MFCDRCEIIAVPSENPRSENASPYMRRFPAPTRHRRACSNMPRHRKRGGGGSTLTHHTQAKRQTSGSDFAAEELHAPSAPKQNTRLSHPGKARAQRTQAKHAPTAPQTCKPLQQKNHTRPPHPPKKPNLQTNFYSRKPTLAHRTQGKLAPAHPPPRAGGAGGWDSKRAKTNPSQ